MTRRLMAVVVVLVLALTVFEITTRTIGCWARLQLDPVAVPRIVGLSPDEAVEVATAHHGCLRVTFEGSGPLVVGQSPEPKLTVRGRGLTGELGSPAELATAEDDLEGETDGAG